MGGDTVTYGDFIANSLAAEAASLPDYVPNRQASGVESKGSAAASGMKGPDGAIFVGHYRNWVSIPKAEKSRICEERKRLGVLSQGDKKRRKLSAVKTKKADVHPMKREIAPLKVKFKNLKTKRSTSSDDDAEDDDDELQDDAGNQFSSRKAKKKRKKKNSE